MPIVLNCQRRKFLYYTLSASGFAVCAPTGMNDAYGQDDDIRRAIKANRSQIGSLFSTLLQNKALPIKAGNAEAALNEEYSLRFQLTKVFEANDKVDAFNYVPDNQRGTALLVLAFEGRIVPTTADLDTAGPVKLSDDAGSGESLGDVVLDIIFDALDLSDIADSVKAIIREIPEAKDALNAIAQSCLRRDWEEATDAISKLLGIMLQFEFIGRVYRRYGQVAGQNIIAKLTKTIGLRLVPIVGWIYAACAIIAAIMKNYDRLKSAN